ncbi:MAG: epoxyqueuosine reductase [Dehalococcoidia bacterium]
MSISSDIRDCALSLGYDRVGFTSAERFTLYEEELRRRHDMYSWATGHDWGLIQGADPKNVLPEARSVVVTVFDYLKHSYPAEMVGKVGRAYQSLGGVPPIAIHRARYRLLREFLEKRGCKVGRAGFDLPARLAAARAGLTDCGKNTFGFASGIGSFVVISTLVIDKELDYGAPTLEVKCPENCTLCLDACPTGALYEPLMMNPRLCIAYNSYNAPGSWFGGTQEVLPTNIRERMGTWIYGCDVCQEVCPRNKPRLMTKLPPNAYLQHIARDFRLQDLVLMSDDHFIRLSTLLNYVDNKRYLQRNAAVALGNAGDTEAVPVLARAMQGPDEVLRGHAAWALGKIGGPRARRTLEDNLSRETSEYVRGEIRDALARQQVAS